MQVGLLEKHIDNPDVIKLDIDMLVAILSGQDKDAIDKIVKVIKIKGKGAEKESKRQITIKALKAVNSS